jgi:uncharacterized RDD family membrane protein YckC
MNDTGFKVVFKGDLVEGAVQEEVQEKLALVFKIDISKIKPLFDGGKKVIKKNATLDACEKTKNAFLRAGAICFVEETVSKQEAKPIKNFISTEVLEELTSLCHECGKGFPESQLLQFEDIWVCTGCKPGLIQKIREGVSVGMMNYAGFWVRFGAKFIDWIILMVISWTLTMVFGFIVPSSDPEKAMIFSIFSSLIQFVIGISYSTYFIGKFAATPGKMACGLKVVTAENEAVSYARAAGRHVSEMLSGLILGIGYIMAGFDTEKRTLHDRLCNTRVIKTK